MNIRVTVQHRNGGTDTVTVWPATEVEFEDYFGTPWGEAFSRDHIAQKHLYFVAWHCMYEDGKTTAPFAQWIKTLGSVSIVTDENPPSGQEAPPTS